jgi:uncharacterized membrane protein YedE/YeeE
MALLNDFTMAKAIATAIGFGIIFVNIEIGMGLASYHIKPLLLGGIIIGGLIFGTGMAILGYCPGTLPISMGEGSLDAFTGFFGAVTGGIIYTVIHPALKSITGPDFGQIALKTLTNENAFLFYILIFLIGGSLTGIAFWLNRIEKSKNYKWLISGALLAVLTSVIFLTVTTDRVLGASGFYPYLGNLLTGNTDNEYFKNIASSGNWEMIFLAGAFLSGLILSLLRKDFKLKLIHENWKEYKGDSAIKRIIWAFAGGILLIFGARLAGGCTSGHIISGGMQLALSSYLFAVTVFGAFLVTGKLFYKAGR